MNPYCLGVDVWEGSLDIDEPTLFAGGVSFVIVRLNDMNGGHHIDENFAKQWAQAEPFIRWPYFVYNPWVSGRENFNWLSAHMPAEARHVSIDIEVRKPGYSASDYAREVKAFLELTRNRWGVDIYTGAWFLDTLSEWPIDVPYWWARYLNRYYPPSREQWTWERLHDEIKRTSWNVGRTPGSCRLWQISGDRLILPGTANRPIDVNVWDGTEAELRAYAGYDQPQPEPLTWQQAVDAFLRTLGYTGRGPE